MLSARQHVKGSPQVVPLLPGETGALADAARRTASDTPEDGVGMVAIVAEPAEKRDIPCGHAGVDTTLAPDLEGAAARGSTSRLGTMGHAPIAGRDTFLLAADADSDSDSGSDVEFIVASPPSHPGALSRSHSTRRNTQRKASTSSANSSSQVTTHVSISPIVATAEVEVEGESMVSSSPRSIPASMGSNAVQGRYLYSLPNASSSSTRMVYSTSPSIPSHFTFYGPSQSPTSSVMSTNNNSTLNSLINTPVAPDVSSFAATHGIDEAVDSQFEDEHNHQSKTKKSLSACNIFQLDSEPQQADIPSIKEDSQLNVVKTTSSSTLEHATASRGTAEMHVISSQAATQTLLPITTMKFNGSGILSSLLTHRQQQQQQHQQQLYNLDSQVAQVNTKYVSVSTNGGTVEHQQLDHQTSELQQISFTNNERPSLAETLSFATPTRSNCHPIVVENTRIIKEQPTQTVPTVNITKFVCDSCKSVPEYRDGSVSHGELKAALSSAALKLQPGRDENEEDDNITPTKKQATFIVVDPHLAEVTSSNSSLSGTPTSITPSRRLSTRRPNHKNSSGVGKEISGSSSPAGLSPWANQRPPKARATPKGGASERGTRPGSSSSTISTVKSQTPSESNIVDGPLKKIKCGACGKLEDEVKNAGYEQEEEDTKFIQIEPFLHNSATGLYLRESDAKRLKLNPLLDKDNQVAKNDTLFGPIEQYESVRVTLFGRHTIASEVYKLPEAFSNTRYGFGMVGTDVLRKMGVNIAMDRGNIYLV